VAVRILHRHGGVFDKMVGDCVIGLFGPPFFRDTTGARAVNTIKAAIEIQAFTKDTMSAHPEMSRLSEILQVPGLGVAIGVNLAVSYCGLFGPNRNYTSFSMTPPCGFAHLALAGTHGCIRLRMPSLTVPARLLAVSACLVAGCRNAQVSESTAELLVEPAAVAFPDTWVGSRSTFTLTVRNAGRASGEARLAGLIAPFSGPQRLTVGGGESVDVELSFAPQTASRSAGVLQVNEVQVPVEGVGLAIPECPADEACMTTAFDTVLGRCVSMSRADGVPCTACGSQGQCLMGQCRVGAVACDDGDACTIDACASTGTCVHEARACPIADACMVSWCDAAAGCKSEPVEDGVLCGESTCLRSFVCIGGRCQARSRPNAVDECAAQSIVAHYDGNVILTRAGRVRAWGGTRGFGRPAEVASGPVADLNLGPCWTSPSGTSNCVYAPDAGVVVTATNDGNEAFWLGPDGTLRRHTPQPPWGAPVQFSKITSSRDLQVSVCGVLFDGGVGCLSVLDDYGALARLEFSEPARDVVAGAVAIPTAPGGQVVPTVCASHTSSVECLLLLQDGGVVRRIEPEARAAAISPGPSPRDFDWEALAFVLGDGGVLACRALSHTSWSCQERPPSEPAVTIARGSDHTCVVTRSGGVECRGSNSSGQLGDSSPAPPQPSRLPFGRFARLWAHNGFMAGLERDGGLLRWGGGRASPTLVPVSGALDVAGERLECVLDGAGQVRCASDGGLNTVPIPFAPTNLGVCGTDVLVLGNQAFCAIREGAGDCTVPPRGCGRDRVHCSEGPTGVTVSAGNDFRVIGVDAGIVRGCGGVEYGAACVLVGTELYCFEPLSGLAPSRMTFWVARQLACGRSRCCALGDENRVLCWGADARSFTQPVRVPFNERVERLVVDAVFDTTCALLASGEAWCWGSNVRAQRGLEPLTESNDFVKVVQ
jgi:hypothetical protein